MQARYNVELEIILPRDMTVQESHDLSLELQHKVRKFCSQLLQPDFPELQTFHCASLRMLTAQQENKKLFLRSELWI